MQRAGNDLDAEQNRVGRVLPNLRSPRDFMGDFSFYGTGCRCFGQELEPPDIVIITQWCTLLFVPLIPLRRARCRYLGDGVFHPHGDREFHYRIVERLPLSLSEAFGTYLAALVGIVIAFGPIAYLLWCVANRPATVLETIFLTASIAWPVVVLIFLEQHRKQMLESSWTIEKIQVTHHQRMAARERRRAGWRLRHVLPEWSFLLAAAVGMIPGVAFAGRNGWGIHAMEIAGLASACSVLAFYAGIDWLIVRILRRDSDQTFDEQL
jgi:hypothetical protein